MSRWPIPCTWEWVTAGQIADIVGGGTPPSKAPGNFTDKGIPWITPADLSGYKGTYIKHGARDLTEKGYAACGARLVPKGTVLFTSRAPIGYCVIAANEICTNQGFKSLVLFSDTSPEYVRYYLLASKEYAESLASGSTFLELSGGRMSEMEIPFSGAVEQRRIADKIAVLDAHSRTARKHLDAIPPLLEQFRAAVLAAAFSGRLTADWREEQKRKGVQVEPADVLFLRLHTDRRRRWEKKQLARMKIKGVKPKDDDWKKKYTGPEPVDATGLPELPEGWFWGSFEDVATIVTDLVTPAQYRRHPHIAPDNIERATGRLLVHRTIAEDCVKSPKHRFRAGQILYSKIRPYLSKVVLVDFDGLCSADMYPVDAHIDARYLYRFMLSNEFLLSVQQSAGSRVVLPKVNQEQLGRVPVPVAPSAEQRKISLVLERLMSSVDNISGRVSREIDALPILDRTILAKGFRGRLVPQDPNDEPASELLKRIAEEKEKMAAEKTPRKSGRRATL